MILFELLTYILMGLSVSFMWSFSEIFAPIRNLVARVPYVRRPLICPECSSFWVGLLVSLVYNPLFNLIGYFSYPFCGLLVHLFACFLYKIYFKLKN